MDIPLNGNIGDVSLVKILVSLNRGRRTGTLSVTTPAFTKKVFIRDGDAVFASSTNPDDRLGEMLLKAGKITVQQYDRSVELLKATKKRQGAILVELGYLTPRDLFWGVKYQVKEIIHSLFQLEDGEYDFLDGELPADEVITLKMSMANLICDGVKKIDSWTRIRNEMPDTGSVLKLTDDPLSLFQGIELSTQDKEILSLIDGTRTIKEVIESSGLGSFEALKILYAFWATGMIEQAPRIPAPGGGERPAETLLLNEVLQPLAGEDEAVLLRIDNLYGRLGGIAAHELLEVEEGADAETVKKNYYRLAKEFHPDRNFAMPDASVKEKLTAIFDALSRAYNEVRGGMGREAVAGTDEAGRAEELFRRGIEAFKRGDFEGAVEDFTEATRLRPGHAAYWSHLSLAFSRMPNRLKDAEGALLTAVKLDPFNADHYANLGLVYLKAGVRDRAKANFEKSLRIDAANDKARKGLAQIRG